MPTPLNPYAICVVGPTASGKTDLAQLIALEFDGEVISADSMQIYKGMDIGTGKISSEDMLVPHHGLDIVDPGVPFSAALFQEYSRRCYADIKTRKRQTVLAGGTGFYVRAFLDDYQFPKGEQENNPVREHYSEYLNTHGPKGLWELLEEKDPKSAYAIHPNNTKRVIRALELNSEGISYAERLDQLQDIKEIVPNIMIGLKVDSDILAERIEARVDKMREMGLVSEVESLLERGFREAITSNKAIGYKEIVRYFDGECSLEQAFSDIKQATRRYAKRQRTWFNKDKRIHWIDANQVDPVDSLEMSISIIESVSDRGDHED